MKIQSVYSNPQTNFKGYHRYNHRHTPKDELARKAIDYYSNSSNRVKDNDKDSYKFQYIIEDADDFTGDSEIDNSDSNSAIEKPVNFETKDIINRRLNAYSDKRNGMIFIDNKVLEAMYRLDPETIKSIGSNRFLYAIVSSERELKSMCGNKILSTNERIAKINELENIFTTEDLQNITFSLYENSHQFNSFLKWMLTSCDKDKDLELIKSAKEPIVSREKRHQNSKPSFFSKIFKKFN